MKNTNAYFSACSYNISPGTLSHCLEQVHTSSVMFHLQNLEMRPRIHHFPLFFFSNFYKKDTQVYELPRSHEMFQASPRVDAWRTGSPGGTATCTSIQVTFNFWCSYLILAWLDHKDSGQCTVIKNTGEAWHLVLPREKTYTERDL